MEKIKPFVEQDSTEKNVENLEKRANEWLEENDGKITIIDRKFETSRNSMYLIYFFEANEN